jgi:hypothetical protein
MYMKVLVTIIAACLVFNTLNNVGVIKVGLVHISLDNVGNEVQFGTILKTFVVNSKTE